MSNYTPHETGPNPYAYGTGQPGPYTPPQPNLPYPGSRPPKKKHTGLKVFAGLAAAAVVLVGGCSALVYNGASDAIDNLPNTIPTVTTGAPPASKTTPGAKKTVPSFLPRDGVLLIGRDVKPGQFRATVPASDLGTSVPSCYVARLRGTSGELGDIITNQNRYPGDVVTLTIRPSDAAVEIHGCGKWARIK